MFNIDPEEEHAKRFAHFLAALQSHCGEFIENHKGQKKRFDSYFFYEESEGKKYIHLTEDAPKQVEKTLQKLIRDHLTPPFRP